MSLLESTLTAIAPIDAKAVAAAEARQLDLTKPPGSLGRLETVGNRLCGVAGVCPPPSPSTPVVALFAGDHGVCAEGVSPWPQEVTVQMAGNILAGGAAISALAAEFGAQVWVTDVGVTADTSAIPGIRRHNVRAGTGNIAVEPAMTRDEARAALEVGIAAVDEAVAAGCDCIITGDMGIGNTTPSAALIAAFTGLPATDVVGRGAGSDDEMLTRKVAAVARTLELHQPDPADALGTLAAVGGLEHAAIAGSILGAARHRIPVIVDGVIASSAALVAIILAPDTQGYLVAGHIGVEPGIRAALDRLGLDPLVDLDLRLGEGSGAIMALPVLRAGARILTDMATFAEAAVNDSGRN